MQKLIPHTTDDGEEEQRITEEEEEQQNEEDRRRLNMLKKVSAKNKIKKGITEIALAGLLAFMPGKAYTSSQQKLNLEQPKTQDKILYSSNKITIVGNGKVEVLSPEKEKNFYFRAGSGYEFNFLPEKQAYTTDLTNKLRDGIITMELTSNISDVKPATNLNMLPIEVGYGIKLNKDLTLWLNGGYEFGKTNTTYSTIGVGQASGNTLPISRTEENQFSNWKIGSNIEFSPSKNFSFGLRYWLNFLDVNQKASLTQQRPATGYTQWRNYSATGNGIGSSVEGEISWNPLEWLSVSGKVGYNWGKVETKGDEKVTGSGGGTGYTQDYNPSLSLDGLNVKLGINLKTK
jgi:hypothetical protein